MDLHEVRGVIRDEDSYKGWKTLADMHIGDEGTMGTMARALSTAVQNLTESLSPDEVEALRLTGELAKIMRRIIYQPSKTAAPNMHSRLRDVADNDWNEAAQRIHAIQHTIMAQAAGRTNPKLCRLLGELL